MRLLWHSDVTGAARIQDNCDSFGETDSILQLLRECRVIFRLGNPRVHPAP